MKYWKKITLASKIVFVFWTIDAFYMLFSGKADVTFGQWASVWLLGYLILVGIAQFLSTRSKEGIRTFCNELISLVQIQENLNSQNYDGMEGHQFEYFCADIMKKNGFINVEVTQGSGDHGIDILADKDGISYAVQCKCYSSNIGNAAVQQAHTGKSLYHKDIAVVLTNRYFTPQAKEEAYALGVKLWDRDKLNEMIDNA